MKLFYALMTVSVACSCNLMAGGEQPIIVVWENTSYQGLGGQAGYHQAQTKIIDGAQNITGHNIVVSWESVAPLRLSVNPFTGPNTLSQVATATPAPSLSASPTKSAQNRGNQRSMSQPLPRVTAQPEPQNPLQDQIDQLFAMAGGLQDVDQNIIKNLMKMLNTGSWNLFLDACTLQERWAIWPHIGLLFTNAEGQTVIEVALANKNKDFFEALLGTSGKELYKRLTRWMHLKSIKSQDLKSIAEYLQVLIEKDYFSELLMVAYFLKDKTTQENWIEIFKYEVSIREKQGDKFKKTKIKQSLKSYFENGVVAALSSGVISQGLYDALFKVDWVMQGLNPDQAWVLQGGAPSSTEPEEEVGVDDLLPDEPNHTDNTSSIAALMNQEVLSNEGAEELNQLLKRNDDELTLLGQQLLNGLNDLANAQTDEDRLAILVKLNIMRKDTHGYDLGTFLAKILNWGWLLDHNGLNVEGVNDPDYHQGAFNLVRDFLLLAINVPVTDENDRLVGLWLGEFLKVSIKEALQAYSLMLQLNKPIEGNNDPIQLIIDRINGLKPESWGDRFDAVIKNQMQKLDQHLTKHYAGGDHWARIQQLYTAFKFLAPYAKQVAGQVVQVVHENPAVQQVVVQRCPWLAPVWATFQWAGSFYNAMTKSQKPKQD